MSRLIVAALVTISTLFSGSPASIANAVAASGPPYDALFAFGGGPANNGTVSIVAPVGVFEAIDPDPAILSLVHFEIRDSVTWPWNSWTLYFASPVGTSMAVGEYLGAQRFATETAPGLSVSGQGSGCNRVVGRFNVREIARDPDGKLLSFAADFEQACDEWANVGSLVSGAIRYHSSVGWMAWSLSTNAVDFGDLVAGATSLPSEVTLASVGTEAISLGAAISGANAADFSLADPSSCLGVIAPGSSCTIELRFKPAAVGTRTAELRLTAGDFLAAERVALTGDGNSPTTTALTVVYVAPYPGDTQLSGSVSPFSEGSLVFKDGGSGLSSHFLRNSEAQADVALAPGPHDLTASYLGSTAAFPSTSDVRHVSVQAMTSTTLTASTTAPVIGGPVELYATVDSPGSYLLNGGVLSIVDLKTQATLARMTVVDNFPGLAATVRVYEPGVAHDFEARYSGTGMFASSVSNPVAISPFGVQTELALTLPAHPHYPGRFDLSAKVVPIPDSGLVTFRFGTSPFPDGLLGNAAINPATGVATLNATLPPGEYYVAADYGGSTYFGSSTYDNLAMKVTIATEIAATVDPLVVPLGAPATISGTVRSIGAADPTAGTLVISNLVTGAFVASIPVTSSNHRISTIVTLPQGHHEFKVEYVGSGDYDSSWESVAVDVTPSSGDVTAPAGNVIINGGASFTSSSQVQLTLSATDPAPGSGVSKMQFSTSGAAGSWTASEDYATSRAWVLVGGDGSNQVYVRFQDGAGNWSAPASAGIVLDTSAPPAVPPSEAFTVGATIGKKIPVVVDFEALDPLSGTKAYSLGQSTNGGLSYTAVSLPNPSANRATRKLKPNSLSYRFRARATDGAGNQSQWTEGLSFRLKKVEESSAVFVGNWASQTSAAASGRRFRQSSTTGATASLTFTGRTVAVVGQMGRALGQAQVLLDGVVVGTIDQYSATNTFKRILFSATFANTGAHTITIKVLGTKRPAATGMGVALDAFLVLG
jgi:hypothetical protein